MIKITSIKLTNIGRHRKVDQIFGGYTVGLTGPNGLGKSTVLHALQWALTGAIDHPDPLRAFIRRSNEESPPTAAEVEVTFLADGREGRIVRRVTRTTSTRKLYWDGAAKPVTSEKKVSALLYDILGVDKNAINSTVFIGQGEMTDMFKDSVDRRDFYTRLLMLGHLAKVGVTLDAHRTHIADSVQDLGAVRDAAESTYREAALYFGEREKDLATLSDPSRPLADVRQLLVLFDNHSEAENLFIKADEALRRSDLFPGEDVTLSVWEEGMKSSQTKQLATFERLNTRMQAHFKAAGDLRSAEKWMMSLTETAAKFLESDALETALRDHGEVGEDPGPSILAIESKIRDLGRRDELGGRLTSLRAAEEDASKKLSDISPELDKTESDYGELRDAHRDCAGDLKMRKDIRAGIESEHLDTECVGCPACGADNPDTDYLDRTISEKTDLLSQLAPKVEKARVLHHATRSRADAIIEVRANATQTLQETEKEYNRLRVTLVLASLKDLEYDLAACKVRQHDYTVHAAEATRLSNLLSAHLSTIPPNLCPPAQDAMDAAQSHVDNAQKALRDGGAWDTVDEQLMEDANEAAASISRELASVQSMTATLAAAKKSNDTASDALQAKIEEITQESPNPFQGVQVALTSDEARDVLVELEARQTDRDEAVGRKEAANESLKAASRKVSELDLRTAEQKHRLQLAADLGRLADTFKPTGASIEYLNYKFGKIAELAADYLAESGADFMVAASEEIPLSFEFLRTDRADEVWMPQNRMSGGQKVRLAVATLRAIHAMVMPNVGLLVLDEPTTHLDEDAKRSMADMLQQIGEEGTLQIIVCDHSPTLVDAFSDTIELPE